MSFLIRISVVLLLLVVFSGGMAAAQTPAIDWKIKKTAWTEVDEKEYSEFVSLIGQAVEKRECNSFESCLQHPNNPFRGSDKAKLSVFADCAKLSYVLRGYFAWKKGLPFSLANEIVKRNVPENTGDMRYSKHGNEVASRLDFLPKKVGLAWTFPNAVKIISKTIASSVYSANFRHYYENVDSDDLFTDFYPVEISREGIVPGTNIYDPNGHVAIVYKVTDDGKIYFIDAHPDNSLTSGLFGTKFERSRPSHSAGFKNFRPIYLEGAQFDSQLGSYVGGVIKPLKDQNLPLRSLEQFFGSTLSFADWKKGVFQNDGITYSYYDYVRIKLSKGNLKLDPETEIKSLAEDLCQTVQDRVHAVQAAITAGISQKAHPERLPVNIYGTSGEWEEYSTPSRDARLKTSFKELRDTAEQMVLLFNQRDPRLVYSGANIKQDMLSSYQQVVQHCQIQYVKSNGSVQKLNLETVSKRLFQLSFDPYHCVEMRWSATTAAELSQCANDRNKAEWYSQQRWLRNQIERKYDARMDFSLDELTGPKPGAGVPTPPDVDVVKYLSN